ncbi:Gfo/Idh/MocA family protein [Reichenbachiella versicolor]|uniref:Gfo/Idh/MocA family protein n=1 Tax=Reichenbachiella versicolor TaxID=1821036 RepID=UPI0013A5915F|nr:Gfo/Idh/MocA family oxidoreductase [Reichenbachiella versicolor]
MNQKVRWGVLGPGHIARQFVSDFQYVESGEVVAVASSKKKRAETFAKEYGIEKVYGAYQELYKDPDIDAIYIATPHNFHFDQAKNALKAGKAVLSEKPITISKKQAEELFSIAKEENKLIMEGMWTYFLPAIQQAKTWVEEGKIGKVLHVKSDFGHLMDKDPKNRLYNPDLAGGSIHDLGIYNIAMSALFTSEQIRSLEATAKFADTGVETNVYGILRYGEVNCHFHLDFDCMLPNRLAIIGEKGRVEVDDFWAAKKSRLYKLDKQVDGFIDEHPSIGFMHEINAFNEAFLAGQTQVSRMPHDASLHFQEVMDTLFMAIKRKK